MSKYLRLNKFSLWLFVTTLLLVSCASVEVTETSRDARGTHGMVAAAHPQASRIGVEILKAGGNAVDAAVAVGFALGVLEPNASGIGGGGFMLIRLADSGKVIYIDSREKAPARATEDMYELNDKGKVKPDARGLNPAVIGGKSVAVPGEVAGLLFALDKYGSMNRKQVMQQAINHAKQGILVSDVLAGLIADHYDELLTFPASEKLYLNEGFPRVPGEKIINSDLATTLQLIADKGTDGFYRGRVAKSIIDAVQSDGGIMTLEDLANYEVSLRSTVTGNYRGFDIISASPPSSGGAHVIELLNIMENFDLAKMGLNSAHSIHAWAEAMKLVYADRAQYMGDTDFIKVPLKGLTSKQYARSQFARIDMKKPVKQQTAGDLLSTESGSTTHFSVVDDDGNMVAYTKTINHFFGSGITVPGTGILLNDEMDDFDKRPGQANSITGGKKPLSSMSPTLLLKNGKPFASIGTPGGKRIITTMALLISNIVDFGMDIQTAIQTPRINNYSKGPLKIESRIPADVQSALVQKGHKLIIKKPFDLYFGGAQGVVIDQQSGLLHGGADPRRDGKAAGY